MTPVSFPGGRQAAMTIIAALPRFASGLFARIGPEMIGGGTGTSHIHPFGVTRRESELARLNASTDVPLRGKGLYYAAPDGKSAPGRGDSRRSGPGDGMWLWHQ